jgi:hypothetical protein
VGVGLFNNIHFKVFLMPLTLRLFSIWNAKPILIDTCTWGEVPACSLHVGEKEIHDKTQAVHEYLGMKTVCLQAVAFA